MKWLFIILLIVFAGWKAAVYLVDRNEVQGNLSAMDSLQAKRSFVDSSKTVTKSSGNKDSIAKGNLTPDSGSIDTHKVQPQEVVNYAKTLMGTPYLYGSTDPAKGFDCSGFITYVFNHFGITVPRSSIDFTNVGKEVTAVEARGGDLILFTGTDSTERFVGHMGIVVSNTDSLRFIHSTSGKQKGVTITPLGSYYQGRYVKTIRVFPQ